jgi:hypothetical protein
MSEQLRTSISRWFTTPWRVVPASPILYVFVFVAGVHVIATTGNAELGFDEAGFVPVVYYWWNFLVVVSPFMVCLAYILIRKAHGHARLWGFWLRLAGDFGTAAAVTAMVTTRLLILSPNVIMSDAQLFSLIILCGVAVFMLELVVRDIGALVVMEKLARQLHEIDHES